MSTEAGSEQPATEAPRRAAKPGAGHVEASLVYLADTRVKPVTYNPPPGTGLPRRHGNYAPFTVRIHDGRAIAGDLSLGCSTISPGFSSLSKNAVGSADT